jgi:hypothetical protein
MTMAITITMTTEMTLAVAGTVAMAAAANLDMQIKLIYTCHTNIYTVKQHISTWKWLRKSNRSGN